jgi:hypothetical protein
MLKDVLDALDYESWWHEHERANWHIAWDWHKINDPETNLRFRLSIIRNPWYEEV